MGGILNMVKLSEKAKTVDAARKDFEARAEYDRYENGHSYSGGIGMIHSLSYIDRIFNSMEEFEEYLLPTRKGFGTLARLRLIRETKPLAKALFDRNVAKRNLDIARYSKDVKFTPALERRLKAKLDKTQAKYHNLLEVQAAKSTKTQFIAGGWCSN